MEQMLLYFMIMTALWKRPTLLLLLLSVLYGASPLSGESGAIPTASDQHAVLLKIPSEHGYLLGNLSNKKRGGCLFGFGVLSFVVLSFYLQPLLHGNHCLTNASRLDPCGSERPFHIRYQTLRI
jgi:hypothetical protein